MSLSRLAVLSLTKKTVQRSFKLLAACENVRNRENLTTHHHQQCLSFSTTVRNFDKLAPAKKESPRPDWNRAIAEGEKIVEYPTSFLSLRWLLSDEIANVALHLRKLVGSSHPLLRTTRNLIYNGKNSLQAWGLIVLLLSKAAGQSPTIPDVEQEKTVGILHSQRALAEVTEMIRISHLIHQGLVNLQPLMEAGDDLSTFSDMTFGNKIALLSGDYLLGNSSAELAGLRSQAIVALISSAVRDLSEAEFIGDRDEQNIPLPGKPLQRNENSLTVEQYMANDNLDNLLPLNLDGILGDAEMEWTVRHLLSAGRLLGKSCQSALKLAGHNEAMELKAYSFGKHMALAWQGCLDLEPFQYETLQIGGKYSLVSAPVLFHIEKHPEVYDEIIAAGKISTEKIDYVKLFNEIMAGDALERTRNLQRRHAMDAINILNELPENESRTALTNIILAMQDL